MEHIQIYKMSPDYRRLEIWSGCKKTWRFTDKLTVTCHKGQTRRARYDHLSGVLLNYGIAPLSYVPSKREKA